MKPQKGQHLSYDEIRQEKVEKPVASKATSKQDTNNEDANVEPSKNSFSLEKMSFIESENETKAHLLIKDGIVTK